MAGLVPALHVFETETMRQGYVYILTNRPSGTLYVGVTSNLVARVWQHKTKVFPGFTAKYGLDRLVYYEEHQLIAAAIQREKAIKHWPRARKVRLILDRNPEWRDLYEDLM